MKAKVIFRQLGNFAFFLSGGFLIVSFIMNLLLSRQASAAADKVDICHWAAAGKYVSIKVDVSAVNKWITQGHGNHPKDIWADFITDDGHFVAGQGDINILENGCVVPATPTDTPAPPTSTQTHVSPTATNTRVHPIPAADKVNICHWTAAGKYVSINVDVSAVNKWLTQGHGNHSNDIWADFTTGDGHFVAGQGDISILENGCVVPATPTYTPVPPTPSRTLLPPTHTYTPDPPTPSRTLLPPTHTYTPDPPTPTGTLLPPTYTYTPVLPTLTDTSIPPTATFTPVPPTPAEDKVNICHWTGADKYVCYIIDVSAVNKWIAQGHGNHPNDIWADFETGDGHFVAGQGDISILENGCEVLAAPTYTPVPPTPSDTPFQPTPTGTLLPPTYTYTPNPLTPTGTHLPPTYTYTPDPLTTTGTRLPPTYTLTPIPLSSTLPPVAVLPPPDTGSNVLFPVTGVDLGAFRRGLPGAFANLCLGFLGLGLVLSGIARRFDG